MTSHIKPLGSRILVKRTEAKASQGGIILPDSAQKKPKEGEVIATGPGKRDAEGTLETMHVQVGDVVLFSSYAGTELTDAEGYLIKSQDDVLAVKVNI